MSTWDGLRYPLRPGTTREVAQLFRRARLSGLAINDENGAQVGRMLSVMAFVGQEVDVRIVDIEGSLPASSPT